MNENPVVGSIKKALETNKKIVMAVSRPEHRPI
jgi:hypothetical protein